MKKQAKILSPILSSALLLSMAVPMTAFAAEEVTAYLYSSEKTDTLNCLFKSSMPDMAYISTADFCSNIFEGTATEVKNDDGTTAII